MIRSLAAARRWFALLGLTGLVLTGCSSSSSSSKATSTANSASGTVASITATSAAPTGTPLVFGVISSDSGPTGSNNDTPTTVKLWQQYVNSHGGIAGHPVTVIEENDNDSAATALQDAQDLIQNKHAIAIGDGTFNNSAFAKVADAANVPVISINQAAASITYISDPNFFANEVTVPAGIWAQPELVKLAGNKKYGFLYCAEVAACGQAVPLERADAASVGVTFNYSAGFNAAAPNYTAQCLAAQSAGVDALFVAGSVQSANQRVHDDCAKQGYQPTAISAIGTLGTSIAKDSKVPVVWGYTGTVPWFVKNDATATFHQVMDGYLPSSTNPAQVAADWVGLQLFAEAAKNVGANPSAQDILTGLHAMNGDTVGGLTSPLSFKSGQPNQVNCFFVYKIDHGSYSTPQGTSPVCAVGALLEK